MKGPAAARPRAPGFTLLEVLAVVLLTSIVLGVALDHYIDLSRAIERALETTRSLRRSAAVLDRVARDLEGVVLFVKPPEVDPLHHPWLFYGDSLRDTEGADHLKFVTRGRRPRSPETHESDLEVVAYTLRHSETQEDQFELMRWTSPRLGDDLDTELPSDEADGAMLLTDGIADFGVTFIDESGGRSSHWDSSQLAQSGALPAAAEIRVALFDASLPEGAEPRAYSRTVMLLVRPLDFEELLDPLSLVSGGPGEVGEAAEQLGEEVGDPAELASCMTTPCSTMTACQALSCASKLGKYTESIDELLKLALRENPTFCQWRINTPPRLRYLIVNPACRV